jgi:hypothetical protein
MLVCALLSSFRLLPHLVQLVKRRGLLWQFLSLHRFYSPLPAIVLSLQEESSNAALFLAARIARRIRDSPAKRHRFLGSGDLESKRVEEESIKEYDQQLLDGKAIHFIVAAAQNNSNNLGSLIKVFLTS